MCRDGPFGIFLVPVTLYSAGTSENSLAVVGGTRVTGPDVIKDGRNCIHHVCQIAGHGSVSTEITIRLILSGMGSRRHLLNEVLSLVTSRSRV